MKVSMFMLLLVFTLLVFTTQAGPNDDKKPKPKPKKPKPKPKPEIIPTMAPSGKGSVFQYVEVLDESPSVTTNSNKDAPTTSGAGVVVVLSGIAAACVVAIVAILRAPTHRHEPLPQSSEHASA